MANRERFSETVSSDSVGRWAISMVLFLPRTPHYLTVRNRTQHLAVRVVLARQGTHVPHDPVRHGSQGRW